MAKLTLPIVLTIFSFSVFGQKSPSKFGEIDIKELSRTSSPIDSTAGAEVLMDWGLTTFDYKYEIALYHHKIVKIYNSNEFDQGDVVIPYPADDRVSRLKASTYNLENGKMVEYELSKKDVFDEKFNENLRQKRFSMPNVKEGSIIEYSYNVNYGGWRSLNTWYFQTSIPVRYSEYVVSIPEYFKYKQLMSGYIQLSDFDQSTKQIADIIMNVKKFVAENVDAFKSEPYMTSKDDVLGKIKFELSTIEIPGQMIKTYSPHSFASLSRGIAEGDYYGKSLNNNKFLRNQLPSILEGSESDLEKGEALYTFVRDSFEIDNDVAAEELRRIFNLRRGYRADITRVFVGLCREAGLSADIVRISTRSHGKINPAFPMRSSFNYTIALLTIDGKEILLDPSVKDQPFGILPEKCLNGRGMLITTNNFRWIDLKPAAKNRLAYTGNFDLDDDGILSGNIEIKRLGYNAIDFRNANKDDIEGYIKNFSDGQSTWYIDDHTLDGVEDITKDISQQIEVEIEDHAELVGDLIIFKPIPYGAYEKNPFETPTREFPVDYGEPYSRTFYYTFGIPSGYTVDEMPAPVATRLPNGGGKFIYTLTEMGGKITITSMMDITKVEFTAEEYPILREFYARAVAKQAENIVLKLSDQ